MMGTLVEVHCLLFCIQLFVNQSFDVQGFFTMRTTWDMF